MPNLIIPKDYKSLLNIRQTEVAIKKVKDFFEKDLAIQLNLTRVSAPLFVKTSSGLNDTLNGIERPVSFDIKGEPDEVEIVQSLAKWKRHALAHYGFERGEGLYTDMNAIRRDEDTDNLHSVYVDQWDWEVTINHEDRNIETLKSFVNRIYASLKHTERYIANEYEFATRFLPENITFITSQELEDKYPDLTPKQREYAITKECGAVFIMQIGGKLKSGGIHDGRAPDYDDWNLNGDIFFWNDTLNRGIEISSMGIRVDKEALERQLKISGFEERKNLTFHKMLLNDELPLTIGGGIGQSRLCMLMLGSAHIGEVQSSVWDKATVDGCRKAGIRLL